MSQLNPKQIKSRIEVLQTLMAKLVRSKTKENIARHVDIASDFLLIKNYEYFDFYKRISKEFLLQKKEQTLELLKEEKSNLQEQLKQFQKPKKLTELKQKHTKILYFEHDGEILYVISPYKTKHYCSYRLNDYTTVDHAYHESFSSIIEAKQKVYELFNNYLNSLESKSKNTNSHNFKKGDIVFYTFKNFDNSTSNAKCEVLDTTNESVQIEPITKPTFKKTWVNHTEIIHEGDIL